MAKREVLVLNETTPQIEAPQSGDSYHFPADRPIYCDGYLIRKRHAIGAVTTTATWDWNNGGFGFTATLGGDAAIQTPTNAPTLAAGEMVDGMITLTQDATGGRVPTWDTVFKNAPTLSDDEIAASAVVDIAVIFDGTDYVLGSPVTR